MMTVNGQIEEDGAVFVVAGFIPVSAKRGARNAVEFHIIGGVIEGSTENTIVVKDKLHDISGAPVLDLNGEIVTERGSSLCGKAAAILYRNGQVLSVKIFPLKQEQEHRENNKLYS